MAFILRPYGSTGLTGAVEIPETALPQTVSALAAGSYDIARLAWSASPIVVTDPPVVVSTFLIGSGAPNTCFVDPSALGSGVTRLRWTARLKLASYPATGSQSVFAQQTNYCDLQMLSQGGGTSANWRYYQKDSAGANVFASNPVDPGVPVPALGTWFDLEHVVDMAARTLVIRVDGATVHSATFATAPATAFFANAANRRLMFCTTSSTGTNLLRAGTEVEYLRVYKTIAGTETLHHEEVGPATAVNANAGGWKVPTSAAAT